MLTREELDELDNRYGAIGNIRYEMIKTNDAPLGIVIRDQNGDLVYAKDQQMDFPLREEDARFLADARRDIPMMLAQLRAYREMSTQGLINMLENEYRDQQKVLNNLLDSIALVKKEK
jgi:hypothetical protein